VRAALRSIVAWAAILLAGNAQEGRARVYGRVVTRTSIPIGDARLVLHCTGTSAQALSDPTGAFQMEVKPAADCVVSVDREGFFPVKDKPLDVALGNNEVHLVLTPVEEVHESVQVGTDLNALDMETTSTQQRLSGAEIMNVPYTAANNLKSAFQAIPGVVVTGAGQVHVNGGGADQTLYTLDGFNLNDPLTGTFNTRMSVESVQSLNVTSGPLEAEYGKGSAGTMAIRTVSGDDRFRASVTNFLPGVEYRKGLVVGNYTPRVNFSGPIVRGRAWFSDSMDLQYDQNIVPELNKGTDRTSSWRGSNNFNLQVNLTPSNILNAGFLMTLWSAPRTGLSAIDPVETTVDRRTRQWFGHIRDQIYFSRGSLIEFGYASNQTFNREIPQGSSLYEITPDGKRGNYFRNETQEGSRDQILFNAFLPAFEWGGNHQFKLGVDMDRVTYAQDVQRTGFVQYRANGEPMREVQFEGNGSFQQTNFEASVYGQDQWKIRPGLLVNAGLRWDWDQYLHRNNIAPRFGFAWSPAGQENLKISGGAGLVYDASNLSVLLRPYDQYSLTTYFAQDGTPIPGVLISRFYGASDGLRSPGFFTYSIGAERRFPHALHVRVNYLGKRGLKGLTYLSQNPCVLQACAQPEAIYRLANQRQDRYDSFEVTVRQTLRGQYEWLASYIRSSARSNASVDVSIDEPYLIPNNSGPLDWDKPNRFLTWAYLPTFWKNWAVATLVEWSSGLPYSVIGPDGRIEGGINSQRFPAFFMANLHAEWKVSFLKQRWALRAGVNNITDRPNPIVVNNIAGGPNFMTFYGGYGRSGNFRIRWLGKVLP
jgi:outer membrane receptor for ferrienterochelin and colicin